MKKYPKRFYNEEIVKIAVSQIQHDFRKLLPDIDPSQWPIIDEHINQWFEGENFELEPAHDFWNFFSGFARGLKLKSLLSWITAENTFWKKQDIPVDDIVITWDFPGLEFMGRAPYHAKNVIAKLNEPDMADHKQKMLEDSQYRSTRFAPRDQYRVILFHDTKGQIIDQIKGFYILEGNRRVTRAIVNDEKTIPAFVGQFKNPHDIWPTNYWINTGMLRDLTFLAIYYDKEKDDKAFDIVRKFYQLLLRDFDNVRVATYDITFKNFEKSDRLSYDLIHEDMK